MYQTRFFLLFEILNHHPMKVQNQIRLVRYTVFLNFIISVFGVISKGQIDYRSIQ